MPEDKQQQIINFEFLKYPILAPKAGLRHRGHLLGHSIETLQHCCPGQRTEHSSDVSLALPLETREERTTRYAAVRREDVGALEQSGGHQTAGAGSSLGQLIRAAR